MQSTNRTEAIILDTKNVLVTFSPQGDESLLKDFCGSVFNGKDLSINIPNFHKKTVYLSGDVSQASEQDFKRAKRVFVIEQLSENYDQTDNSDWWSLVDIGQVPLDVHGIGVFYPRFFDPEFNHFQRISTDHDFQYLTESNKPGRAHRTGIYLTPVEKDGEDLHFRLLRCSTNLSGPTENFCASDRRIVNSLNEEASWIFQHQAPLNHVLAQIYHNTPSTEGKKQTKAKISSHADKTKDMPSDGIMAFCTFYDQLEKLKPLPDNPFDLGYKKASGLTQLRFRLKRPVKQRSGKALPREFSVTLYPNSVFFMPLSTNRLYTHQIQPSTLDAELLPTRLGYVVRCSSTEAVHSDGQTFLKMDGRRVELEPPTPEGMSELRRMYAEENKSQDFIDYGNQFLFSMNKGDYTAPDYKLTNAFRSLTLYTKDNLFKDLFSSVKFESLGKGRLGTVLVKANEDGDIPIVRTTARYHAPAQHFRPVHERVAKLIQEKASLPLGFNNALIESYTNEYFKMGSHSDMAIDLVDGSYIALFSCYEYPDLETPPRKLVVEPKEPGGETFELPLPHNSVVVFSLETNRRYKHKIVLDVSGQPPENRWLGVTFRLSGTFVQQRDEGVYFQDNTPLALATDEERKVFYKLRGRENSEMDFFYPKLTYTISKSDLMSPK